MSENTKIEWCDHTFNPWEGCQKVSPGCDNCYAEARNTRFGGGTAINWGPGAPRRRTSAANWALPKRWNAQADAFMSQHGRRQRVFCASLADVFDNAVDPEWLSDLFDLIRHTPNLDWLLLTKRIGNWKSRMLAVQEHLGARLAATPKPRSVSDEEADAMNWVDAWIRNDVDPIPENVWLGATIVNQAEADRDIPKLLAVPARVRFLSMEPLLEPVQLTNSGRIPADDEGPERIGYMVGADDGKSGLWPTREKALQTSGLNWVIVGGESGPNARPMHPDWARSLRDQCEAAGVPFLFKQWGEWHTSAYIASTGEPVFRQFDSHQQWVNKARTWVNGGICLDRHGRELRNGGDMARARDQGDFPVTIMHKVGKKAAGRTLDGRTWDGMPQQ